MLVSILRTSRAGVRLNEHFEHPYGLTVFQHACVMGLEGILCAIALYLLLTAKR
jgi:hypothetical protein